MRKLLQTIASWVVFTVACVALIIGFVLFSYLLIAFATFGLVVVCIAYAYTRLCWYRNQKNAFQKPAKNDAGRVIDHRDN